jgi:hypothetical protein
MIGYSQGHDLGLGEFRTVTGIVAVPAVRNIASVTGESHVRQLRGTQLGAITRLAARLARIQILRKIERLSKRKNWPQAKTPEGHPKIFPETGFHIARPSKDQNLIGTEMLVSALVALAGTGKRFRPAHKFVMLIAF